MKNKMHNHLLGWNQSGICNSETEAKEKWGIFAFPTQGIYLKTCSKCVRKQNVGLWQKKIPRQRETL